MSEFNVAYGPWSGYLAALPRLANRAGAGASSPMDLGCLAHRPMPANREATAALRMDLGYLAHPINWSQRPANLVDHPHEAAAAAVPSLEVVLARAAKAVPAAVGAPAVKAAPAATGDPTASVALAVTAAKEDSSFPAATAEKAVSARGAVEVGTEALARGAVVALALLETSEYLGVLGGGDGLGGQGGPATAHV